MTTLLWFLGALGSLAPQEPFFGSKLNGPITFDVPTLDGQVVRSVLVPDSTRALFLAQRSFGSTQHDLFVAPLDRSAEPLRLDSGRMNAVLEFRADPSSTWAVLARDGVLRSVRLDGSAAPVTLSAADTENFVFDAARAAVVFVGDHATPGVDELFTVPVDGSAPPVRLSGALVPGGDVSEFTVGSGIAVYRADQAVNQVFELFRVPLDGSAPAVRLGGPMVAGGDVSVNAFEISGDGARVAYLADQTVDGRVELFSVPSAGGPSVALSGDLAPQTRVRSFRIEPLGTRCVFLSDRVTRGVDELFGAPIDGGTPPVRLNGALVAGNDVLEYQITPDGAQVVYLAEQDVDGMRELYRAPLDGGAPAVQVSGELAANGDVTDYLVTATHAAYRANGTGFAEWDFYAAPLDGSGPAARLYDSLLQGVERRPPFVLAEGGRSALFFAEQHAYFASQLVRVVLDGSEPARVLDAYRQQPLELAVTPDGTQAAYLVRKQLATSYDLWAVRLDGKRGSVFVNEAGPPSGGVQHYEVNADGTRVVHLGLESFPSNELYATALEPGFPRIALNEPMIRGAQDFRLDPRGRFVAFRHAGVIYRAPLDGSTAPHALSDSSENPFPSYAIAGNEPAVVFESNLFTTGGLHLRSRVGSAGGTIARLFAGNVDPRLVLDPDGERVVFAAGLAAGDPIEVHSAPTLAGGPVRLGHGDAQAFTDVPVLALTPDGRRALFLTDRAADGRYELCSAPVDASAPAATLHAPLLFGESVGRYLDAGGAPSAHEPPFVVAPDGRTVLFPLHRASRQAFELLRAPLDGSAPATTLARWSVRAASGSPASHGALDVDPRGKLAFYQTGDRGRLFAVRMDGLEPPVELGDASAAGGGVPARFGERAFRVSADGRYVVFLADKLVRGRDELFRVPSDGSGKALRLSAPLQPEGTVLTFALDGAEVVYLADQEQDEVFELYHVSLAGGASARLHGTLVEGGDVRDFTLRRGNVVYRADQDIDEVLELYVTSLPPLEHRRTAR